MNWFYPSTFWGLPIVVLAAAGGVWSTRRFGTRLLSLGTAAAEWRIRSLLRVITSAVFFILLLTAAAEPRGGNSPVSGERSGIDIAVAFDVSRSMLARDISPSRLERGVGALGRITRSISDSRYSLIPFKGDAVPLVPMTADREVLGLWMGRLGPGLSSAGGTDLEAALRAASNAFPGGTGRSQVLIIISDGESLTGRPETVSRSLAERGIPVHILLTGTAEGAPIPLEGGRYITDAEGRTVVSRAAAAPLERVSRETGGSFHDLARPNAVTDLIKVIQDRREFVEKRGIRFVGVYRYRIFLVPALIFALVNLLIRILPWRGR